MSRLALLDPTRTGRQAKDLEDKLRHLVIGQEDNSPDREVLPDSLGGLSPVGRPIGNFLFLGPTGFRKNSHRGGHRESLLKDSRAVIKNRLRGVSTQPRDREVDRLASGIPGPP